MYPIEAMRSHRFVLWNCAGRVELGFGQRTMEIESNPKHPNVMAQTNTLGKRLAGMACATVMVTALAAQMYVNKEWAETTGLPDDIDWTATALDNEGNILVVGNTLQSTGNPDVLISKYSRDGELIWQRTYGGNAEVQDYGVAVATDNSGNCYVAATVTNTGSSLDIAVLKYNAAGDLIWHTEWNGPSNLYDAPSSVALDPLGNVYVAGTTYGSPTNPNYALLKLNPDGNLQWASAYDYAGFPDVATGISFDAMMDPVVTGGSATAADAWDYATVRYNKASGVQSGTNRVNVPGVGLDNALAFIRGTAGDLYITGYREVNGEKDIQTVKLDNTFTLAWVVNYDGEGLADEGRAIGADNSGNVYVAGRTDKANGGSDFITIKYGPAGEVLWQRRYQAKKDIWMAEANKLAVSADGGVIVVGTIFDGERQNFMTVKYTADGKLEWEKEYNGLEGDAKGKDILVGTDGKVYVTGVTSAGSGATYTTVKYSALKTSNGVVYDQNGDPYCMDHELIVKFRPSVVNTDFVDDKGSQYAELEKVVGPAIAEAMKAALGVESSIKPLYLCKIYKRLTTADSISISRTGNEVRVPKFWSSFLLKLPPGLDLNAAKDSLGLLTDYIDYAEVNGVGVHTNAPNDPDFSVFQPGLIPNASYPDGSINLDGAWDIQTGQPYVKVGVYDDPIYWAHEEFGDGTYSGSKVRGGYDYYNGTDLQNVTDPPNSHGTAEAGIIGALRNNGQGVAGIAGGDVDSTGNTGADLYSMAIFNNNNLTTFANAANAIEEGANSNGYGLHIQNHAWATTIDNAELRTAIIFCFQNECLLVAGRGNGGAQNIYFPACSSWGDWVLSVGASGTDGKRHTTTTSNPFSSSYGLYMDLLAPGVTELVATTQYADQPYNWNSCGLNGQYTCFSGTSASCAIASGVAALLMSEYNVQNGRDHDLAPDDVTYLMEHYAKDLTEFPYTVGPDAQSGWGLIDATNTMDHIVWPHYSVFHSGEPNTSSQTSFGGGPVHFTYPINGLSPGIYTANKVQVTHTYTNTFTPSTEVLGQWPRYSGTLGFNYNSTDLDGRPYGNYTFTVTGNTVEVTAVTATYQINGQWYPAAPGDVKTAYSLNLYDPLFDGINESTTGWNLNAFPNPAMDELNVYLDNDRAAHFRYAIYDVSGRLVSQKDLGIRTTLRETLPIGDLAHGTYTLQLWKGNDRLNRSFVKF